MKNRNPFKLAGSNKQFMGPAIIASGSVLLTGVVSMLFVGLPAAVKHFVSMETRLVPGNEVWRKWVDIEEPVLMKFHLFNVTNPDAVQNGSRFQVLDVGPYVWQEKRSKIILHQDEEEDSVTFKEVIYYYFRPDLSVGSEDDLVNIVNIPFISASKLIYEHVPGFIANIVIDSFVNEGEKMVLRNIKVGDLCFHGVKINDLYDTLGTFAPVGLPDEFIDGTFAFNNGKNGTPGKEYKINRGVKDHRLFGQVISFEGKKELSWWTNDSLPEGEEQFCNKINGSDGSIVPPFLTKESKIHVFHHEICSSAFALFDSEQKYKGIPVFRYGLPSISGLPKDLLSQLDTTYRCFCPDPENGLHNECLFGVLRVANCRNGAPLLLSKPHFLDADESIVKNVSGLNPTKELHDSEILVEPISGAILKALKRVQVSLEVQTLPGIHSFQDVPHAYVPLVWVEEIGVMDDSTVSEIRHRLIIPLKILIAFLRSAIGIFSFTILVGIYATLRRKKIEEPLL